VTAKEICIEVAVYRNACEGRNTLKPGKKIEAHRALDGALEEGRPMTQQQRLATPVDEASVWGDLGSWVVASSEEQPLEPTIFMRSSKSAVSLALGDARTPSEKAAAERRVLAMVAAFRRKLSDARREGTAALRRIATGYEAHQLLGWLASLKEQEREGGRGRGGE